MAIRRLLPALVLLVATFAAAALLLPKSPSGLRDLLFSIGAFAPLVAVGAWLLLTPALFPGTVLAAASGLAFGTVGGVGLALGGAVAGGVVAFVLARTVARTHVEGFVARHRRLSSISHLLERRGFAAVLAARLMPGVPATALHYAAGLSPVRLRSFVGAMSIGALLRTVPYVLLGQGIGTGSPVVVAIGAASIVLGGAGGSLLLWQLKTRVAT
jgi:uncharacterized membrane protein YdjX (TVP38/TMEM64 family)